MTPDPTSSTRRRADPIQVLLVDDHQIVREGLASLISAEGDLTVVAQASSGKEALHKAMLYKPQIAVVDVNMPSMNGAELASEFRRLLPQVGVIALSQHTEPQFLESMLRAGVHGYVVKSDSYDELVAAIHATINGAEQPYLSSSIKDVATALNNRKTTGCGITRTTILSRREKQVLMLLAHGRRTRDIAEECGISAKTVDTYRRRIMAKLDVDNPGELIRKAIELEQTLH